MKSLAGAAVLFSASASASAASSNASERAMQMLQQMNTTGPSSLSSSLIYFSIEKLAMLHGHKGLYIGNIDGKPVRLF
jgi:type IV secretory pathway VirB2 component (pilin)